MSISPYYVYVPSISTTSDAKARRKALVTGASSGIGRAYARELSARGYDLIVVARRQHRLAELSAELRDAGTQSESLIADLTNTADRARVVARIERGDVSFVANVAGFGHYGRFDRIRKAEVKEVLAIHVSTVADLTHAAVTHGTRQTIIVNVGSLLALSGGLPPNPMPERATYAGAKSFVLTFTETLAAEKIPDIQFQVVLPGMVASEYGGGYPADRSMSPEDVVQASFAGLERNEIVCVPGLDDPDLLIQLEHVRHSILKLANRRELSARYRAAAENSSASRPFLDPFTL